MKYATNPLPALNRWHSRHSSPDVNKAETAKAALLFSLSRFISACLIERLITAYSFLNPPPLKRHPVLKSANCERLLRLQGRGGQLVMPSNCPDDLINLRILDMPIYNWRDKSRTLKSYGQFFDALRDLRLMKASDLLRARSYFGNSFANVMLAMLINHDSKQTARHYAVKYRNDTSYLEAKCTSGHILYPFPKLRAEFEFRDSLTYSNERKDLIDLPLFAIPRRSAIFSSITYPDPSAFFQGLFGPRLLNEEQREFLSHHDILPVHPWQLRNVKFIKKLRETKKIMLLPITVQAKSLVSIRTLYCPEHNLEVKLPLAVTVTSEKRLIYQNNAHNAPIISHVLSEIIKTTNINSLTIQEDIASIRYSDFVKGPFLAAIFRRHVSEELLTVPATYLFDEMTDRELRVPVVNIIESFLGSTSGSPRDFFRQYCRVLLEGPLLLLLRFGIGLEPHLQNVLIRFRDSQPEMLIIRDTDGANISPAKLSRAICITELPWHPRTWHLMKPERFSFDRFWHAAIRSHVGKLIEVISSSYDEDAKGLWGIVGEVISEFTGVAASESDRLTRQEIGKSAAYFFRKHERIKCLLRMRLIGTSRFITASRKSPLGSSSRPYQRP